MAKLTQEKCREEGGEKKKDIAFTFLLLNISPLL